MSDVVLRPPRTTKWKTVSFVAAEDDHRLSWTAVGELMYLISRPDGWKFRERDLINRGSDGRHAVRAALAELEACGYRKVEQTRRRDGTFGAFRWHVSEHPIPAWSDNPDATREVLARAGVEVPDPSEIGDSQPDDMEDDVKLSEIGDSQPDASHGDEPGPDGSQDDGMGWGDEDEIEVEIMDLARRLDPKGREFLIQGCTGWGPAADAIDPDHVARTSPLQRIASDDTYEDRPFGWEWEERLSAELARLSDDRRDGIRRAARRVLDLQQDAAEAVRS